MVAQYFRLSGSALRPSRSSAYQATSANTTRKISPASTNHGLPMPLISFGQSIEGAPIWSSAKMQMSAEATIV